MRRPSVNPDERYVGTVSPLVVPEIVVLPAEIDIANAAQVGDDLLAALGAGAAVVIADMTLTEFCDSSGIRYLLIAHDRAIASTAELRLVITSAAVLRVLQTIGLDRLLRIYPSLHAALTNDVPERTPEIPGLDG
jgi:anti-sigma B factor antagonist